MGTLTDHLNFVRGVTLRSIEGYDEKETAIIPRGFNNNILWNLGHIYLFTEQFVYSSMQEHMLVPGGFPELFAKGTKPADWVKKPPQLQKITEMLQNQPARFTQNLAGRFDEELANPHTVTGLTLNTVGEKLMFSFYHESKHVQAIRMLKKAIDASRL